VQELAAEYIGHFSLDFGDQPTVSLSEDAPGDLRELIGLITEAFGEGKQVCVYEALCVIADSELPYCAEVDEKVCPLDIYFIVVDYLGARVPPTNGGD